MKTLNSLVFSTVVFGLFICGCASAETEVAEDNEKGRPIKRIIDAITQRSQKTPKKAQANVPEYFGMYTATLDGKNFTEILRDPQREMNHARVSNDHQWIVFTRYNKFNPLGIAVEEYGNYEETEIMICRIDGSELQTIIPSKKGHMNANGNWTPDNKGIIYISSENPSKKAQIYTIDLATRKKTRVPTPEGVHATDPHMVGDSLVYPLQNKNGKFAIYMMRSDGTMRKQITAANARSKVDADPKLSPDKSKVAIFRNVENNDWRTIVVDVNTGVEKDISPPNVLEGVAEWSSDSKLLVFFHLNRKDFFGKSGLYTVRPDGSDRQKIPLPSGYWYTMPAFFPETGSGKDAKIIFSARKFPPSMLPK